MPPRAAGGVDQHAAGGNGGGKALSGVGILGVDGEGVARALPLQDLHAAAEHRLLAVLHIVGQNQAQLSLE